MSISKSSSLHVEKGSKISDTKIKFRVKSHGAMKYVLKTVKTTNNLQNKLKKRKRKYRNDLLK